ncbi:N-6 DNA methylase [Candidatus Magnetaquiglobus chichijimensis]|uniref:N-6 DNA methylase n=1 Tax=Candidatus Magnetaquiglobus chichijimensis TaxID=3141448 RepID=UPI003B976680
MHSAENVLRRAFSKTSGSTPKPETVSVICDPACGSGSLLIDVDEQIGGANFQLFGQR